MLLTGQNHCTQGKTCSWAALSTTNCTSIYLELKLDICSYFNKKDSEYNMEKLLKIWTSLNSKHFEGFS
jgi:hypothetical protein